MGGGRFRRGQELHRLRLHDPDAVLELLGDIGLSARILPDGYAGERLPPGMIAYLARRPR